MNSQEFKNICRICLEENVASDWNATLYGFCNITYKDCFYKYTQLECLESDPFSSMLCQICMNGLHSIHTLILKAIEANKYFQETYANFIIDHPTELKDIKYTPTEFETVLLTKSEDELIVRDEFIYEHTHENMDGRKTKQCPIPTSVKQEIPKKKVEESITIENQDQKNNISDTKVDKSGYIQRKKSQRLTTICKQEKKKYKSIYEKIYGDENEDKKVGLSRIFDANKDLSMIEKPKMKTKCKELKKPRMCSICSKILHNKYAVQMHEKTHMENRERNETCKICGLKFYDKRNLYSHKRIHKENREKNHKCEFCDKAFYNKGALNIHRRIHLGQMVPCSLCTKQFFRKIDLERHMSSHSATTINSDAKKRSRYFVRCEHCNKSILSTSFKSHTAAHLNEPLMKCSICGKEFFRRGSCVLHVKKIHQKNNEEYNNFIVKYKKNRISHLYLSQKADIQFCDK